MIATDEPTDLTLLSDYASTRDAQASPNSCGTAWESSG